MAWEALPGFWNELPYGIAGVAVLLLGLVVLALDPRRSANRAFAALCVARGIVNSTAPLGFVDDGAAQAVALTVNWYFESCVIFIVAWFVAVYPRRRAWAPPRWALPLLGVGALLALAASALVLLAVPEGERLALAEGPFLLRNVVVWLAYSGALVVFARDLARAEPGRARTSLFLVHAAFAVIIARNATSATWVVQTDEGAAAARSALNIVVGALGLAAAAFVLARAKGDEAFTRARRATFLLVLVVIATSLLGRHSGSAALASVVRGLWYLAFPGLVAYALLRYRLFGLDVKVRWTIRQSTIAGAFIAVFFVVSEMATQIFSTAVGTFTGIVAAGALVFAMAPLQRAAERLASAATDDAKPAAQMAPNERVDAYRALVEHAWADRVLTAEERALLSRARNALGLTADDALRVEDAVFGRGA